MLSFLIIIIVRLPHVKREVFPSSKWRLFTVNRHSFCLPFHFARSSNKLLFNALACVIESLLNITFRNLFEQHRNPFVLKPVAEAGVEPARPNGQGILSP